MSIRLAVLVSGRGSNLQAIINAISQNQFNAEIVGVFSNKPNAPALQFVPPALRWSQQVKDFNTPEDFDIAMADAIVASEAEWVICAGYMRILRPVFVQRFAGKVINIHPSLLPKYRGLHTHARAIEAGDAEHGSSVHQVIPELDAGTVIAQAHIPILPGDNPEQLAERLLPQEHHLLVAVLQLIANKRLTCNTANPAQLLFDGQPLFMPLRLQSDQQLR